jgi:hypothetical protein
MEFSAVARKREKKQISELFKGFVHIFETPLVEMQIDLHLSFALFDAVIASELTDSR